MVTVLENVQSDSKKKADKNEVNGNIIVVEK